MKSIGLDVPRSFTVHTMEEAREAVKDIGLPIIIRASFTLGGTGGGIAYNIEEFEDMVRRGLALSPINEVLLEESILGWKEYEMEVMRDNADNVVIICAIENFDPMGVHTGDSITVAPAQTLTDKEYQRMRDATIAVMRAIGVETGGSNVQFAIHPDTGRMTVIEMNPRVSRSSALASKATGFRSRRSPPSWPLVIDWTKSPTISLAKRWRALNRQSTTSSRRFRAGRSRNSRKPIRR
jgi:carbamoyl-phosphate synthase large subunit